MRRTSIIGRPKHDRRIATCRNLLCDSQTQATAAGKRISPPVKAIEYALAVLCRDSRSRILDTQFSTRLPALDSDADLPTVIEVASIFRIMRL
jgi:hypothetical protein